MQTTPSAKRQHLCSGFASCLQANDHALTPRKGCLCFLHNYGNLRTTRVESWMIDEALTKSKQGLGLLHQISGAHTRQQLADQHSCVTFKLTQSSLKNRCCVAQKVFHTSRLEDCRSTSACNSKLVV